MYKLSRVETFAILANFGLFCDSKCLWKFLTGQFAKVYCRENSWRFRKSIKFQNRHKYRILNKHSAFRALFKSKTTVFNGFKEYSSLLDQILIENSQIYPMIPDDSWKFMFAKNIYSSNRKVNAINFAIFRPRESFCSQNSVHLRFNRQLIQSRLNQQFTDWK